MKMVMNLITNYHAMILVDQLSKVMMEGVTERITDDLMFGELTRVTDVSNLFSDCATLRAINIDSGLICSDAVTVRSYYQDYMDIVTGRITECPDCGCKKLLIDYTVALTSDPPKYNYRCVSCGHTGTTT